MSGKLGSEGAAVVVDGEEVGVVVLPVDEEEKQGEVKEEEVGKQAEVEEESVLYHAMASPKPTKPVQPAPSSRMRRALFLVPVNFSLPGGNQRV